MGAAEVLTVLASVVAALGGLEAVKWLATRRAGKRVAETQADTEEFHYLKERLDYLNQQIDEKERRFTEQTELVRKLNKQLLDDAKEHTEALLSLHDKNAELMVELAMKRCEVEHCPKRKPPSGY